MAGTDAMLHFSSRLACAAALVIAVTDGLTMGSGPGLPASQWLATGGGRIAPITAATLVLLLALVIARWEPRAWVRRLGLTVCGAVAVLAATGVAPAPAGSGVAIGILRTALAQAIFGLTVALATVTSPGWHEGYQRMTGPARGHDRLLAQLTSVTTAAALAHILASGIARHTGAGLLMPDLPLTIGDLIPARWDIAMARVIAPRAATLAVALVSLATLGHVLAHHRRRPDLRNPALLLLGLTVTQLALAATPVWTANRVAAGAVSFVVSLAILGAAVALMLRTHRLFGRAALSAGSSRVRASAVTQMGVRA